MAITNVKGGKPSGLQFGPTGSLTLLGELQSLKSEWTPNEIDYDDGQITYTTGQGVIEAVVLPSDATTISTIQSARATEHYIQATGSDSRVFQSALMTFTSKPTRFEGNVDMILLRGTKETALESDFFFEL